MNAEYKAEELVDKFSDYNESNTLEEIESIIKIGKRYALICVDEIIDSHYKVFTGTKASVNDYWQDVKQEINKL